jgi:hypothetical protein
VSETKPNQHEVGAAARRAISYVGLMPIVCDELNRIAPSKVLFAPLGDSMFQHFIRLTQPTQRRSG